jgi:hypothetical protein
MAKGRGFVVNDIEVQPIVFFAEREFTCWREREYNDQYACQVSGRGNNGVSVNLDNSSIGFSKGVALEIAYCLKDAFLVNLGNQVGALFTSPKRNCTLERKFRKTVSGRWIYTADGQFRFKETAGELHFSKMSKAVSDATGKLGVYTVDDEGVELVFDFMCFSFSVSDALWLADNLLEAVRVGR